MFFFVCVFVCECVCVCVCERECVCASVCEVEGSGVEPLARRQAQGSARASCAENAHHLIRRANKLD